MSSHPLDPLTAAEVGRAGSVARTAPGLSGRLRFVSVETREPAKADYLAWRDDGAVAPAREAFIVLVDCDNERGVEVIVSLEDDRLVSHRVLDAGVHPAIHGEEFVLAGDVVKAAPAYVEALRLRGIDDPEQVHVEAWSAGQYEDRGRRLVRAISWLKRDTEADNQYARPLYGLVAVVDLNRMELVRLDDHAPGTPPPPGACEYHDALGKGFRDDLKPISITQPEGRSFVLDGNHIAWQKWDMVIAMHPREGLVLHDIAYTDDGARRQICHRASMAELVIPYGDPNPTTHFKNVFDTGEYGMGPLTNSLVLGCDCLGDIAYLDGVTNSIDGEPLVIDNAICIHEEDYNLLWKHTNDRGRVDRARSRRLVISSIATVGNYEYGYFWYFYQDGSWQFEAKLTGILHTAGWISAERSPHALPLGEGFVTSAHQHFFVARLDLDIDGTANVAYQADAISDPWGPANPDGAAFRNRRTTYERESQAKAHVSAESARRFRVENTGRLNRIGDPVSYELIPGENVLPMAQPDSGIRKRARVLDHHVWVTPYRREERYPAGEYPNQSAPGQGIGEWTAADRNLLDEDVVLWYVFGAHHFPRLEDWPVMPVVYCGFHLRPIGFFDYNPALDVPPPKGHCHP
jgi:primary-amine oxidase